MDDAHRMVAHASIILGMVIVALSFLLLRL